MRYAYFTAEREDEVFEYRRDGLTRGKRKERETCVNYTTMRCFLCAKNWWIINEDDSFRRHRVEFPFWRGFGKRTVLKFCVLNRILMMVFSFIEIARERALAYPPSSVHFQAIVFRRKRMVCMLFDKYTIRCMYTCIENSEGFNLTLIRLFIGQSTVYAAPYARDSSNLKSINRPPLSIVVIIC